MSDSKSTPAVVKPYKDFPLFPHATGRWAKKVKGKMRYFGSTATDPTGERALELWEHQRDALMNDKPVPPPPGNYVALRDVVNDFLRAKKLLLETGELAPRTFDRYYATCAFLVDQLGRNTRVDDLTAREFQKLRAEMAKRWGPVALGNEVQMVRSIFRRAYDGGMLDKPVRFGPDFKKPSAMTIRKSKGDAGPKLFESKQIRGLLKIARPAMKAMILLGINGGLGNTDVAKLTAKPFDLDGGWLNYRRTKTGMPRRIPLMPETVDAVRDALAKRRTPNDPADADLLFIGHRGESYVGGHKGDRVGKEFKRLCKKVGCPDRVFYDLRRSFQTVAEDCNDLVAVKAIMGHVAASGDMSAVYRQKVSDERLRAAVDTVRAWLYPADEDAKEGAK